MANMGRDEMIDKTLEDFKERCKQVFFILKAASTDEYLRDEIEKLIERRNREVNNGYSN